MATMTNTALKNIVNGAGKKVRAIRGTAFTILVNQPYGQQTVTLDDIEFLTYDGVDLLKVKTYNPHMKNHYYKFYATDDVKCVVVMDNENDFIEPSYLQV